MTTAADDAGMTQRADLGRVAEQVKEVRGRQLPRYPVYKPSGVQWLQDIPAHWQVMRLKYVGRIESGGTPSMSNREYWDGDIPWVSPKDMGCFFVTDTADHITEAGLANSSSRMISAGAVLLVVRSGILRHSIPVAINRVPVAINQDIRAITLRDGHVAEYLAYLIDGNQRAFLNLWSKQGCTVESIEVPDLVNSSTIVPPASEQHAIVSFLDRETAYIDALITKRQQLIELLEEKRTTLISHAVTKGLDPRAGMKPSGIDALGDIPQHWQCRRLAMFAVKLTNGYVGPTRDILVKAGIPYIQSLHIKDNRVIFNYDYFVDEAWLTAHSKARLQTGDVVVVQTGDIGQVACVPPEYHGAGCHALIIIRPHPDVMRGAFLSLVLNSNYGFDSLKRVQTGALHPHLNCTWVREINVPIPSLPEQDLILNESAAIRDRYDAQIAKTIGAVELLVEYRSALISAAVTGKIDVRREVV